MKQANQNVSNSTIYVGEKLVLPSINKSTSTSDNVQAQPQQTQSSQQVNNQIQSTNSSTNSSNGSNSARDWIASHESGGSYGASNGQYYGKYQVSKASLNGDYSEANQERVADQYVNSRYGSWENAKSFWQQNGWY